jgi:adenosylhomocysteine nucleosidase
VTIIAVVGLSREAKIAAVGDVFAMVGGGNSVLLRRKLDAATTADGVISIGIAGGLAPKLECGACIVASEVIGGTARFSTHVRWRDSMLSKLPDATLAAVMGTDSIVASPETKAELHRATGAAAADMESHIAARFAAERKIPFVALRVVADPATSALPPAALSALSSDGTIRYGAVLRSVLANPSHIPALTRTAGQSRIAFAVLLRCVRALGDRLAAPDFG